MRVQFRLRKSSRLYAFFLFPVVCIIFFAVLVSCCAVVDCALAVLSDVRIGCALVARSDVAVGCPIAVHPDVAVGCDLVVRLCFSYTL